MLLNIKRYATAYPNTSNVKRAIIAREYRREKQFTTFYVSLKTNGPRKISETIDKQPTSRCVRTSINRGIEVICSRCWLVGNNRASRGVIRRRCSIRASSGRTNNNAPPARNKKHKHRASSVVYKSRTKLRRHEIFNAT